MTLLLDVCWDSIVGRGRSDIVVGGLGGEDFTFNYGMWRKAFHYRM